MSINEKVSRADGSIIDRRTQGGKSLGNRERFLKRYSGQIKEAVKRAIDGRSIKDIANGQDVHVPKRDLSQPIFGHGQGGRRKHVHPGNKEYVKGDRIERPRGGQGGGQASDSGEGDDDFVFRITKEEFMKYFFDDLALPNLERKVLAETPDHKSTRAGYSTDGTQNNLAMLATMLRSKGRRLVFHKAERERLLLLLDELDLFLSIFFLQPVGYDEALQKITDEINALETKLGHDPGVESLRPISERVSAVKDKLNTISFLDPIDLRFRARVRVPQPTAKAVMFCLMDISGSMDENRKDLSKRFFILLYLFLTRHYDKIDIVFIRHHTQAAEVDEQNFFHATETGGTVVSSALMLMDDIIRARYPTSEWNIYGAQASDGDNWHQDSGRCRQLMAEQILPLCRYFAYIQVAEEEQNLWTEYAQLTEKHFAMRKVLDATQIFPVFQDLFKKKEPTT